MIKKHQYISWLTNKGLQPRTIKEYEYCLDNLIKYPTFDQANVDQFINKYNGGMVRSFVKSYKKYLLRNPDDLGISLEDQKKINFIVVETKRANKRNLPLVITEAEVVLIEAEMPNAETKLLLNLSFYCGLRREELITLKAGMFNFISWVNNPEGMGVLSIVGKGNKAGVIPVKQEVMADLYNYLPAPKKSELPFPIPENVPVFPDMKARRWSRILGRAGKAALGKHIKPHTLRHSIAMHLRGKDFAIDEVKEFLRHEDISTTQIYSRVTPEQLMDKFSSL